MWRSASCSERTTRRRLVLPAALVLAGAWAAGPAWTRVFLDQDQALRLAFGSGAAVDRVSLFLTEPQVVRARSLAGPDVPIESALLVRYRGRQGGRFLGTAYFDTHRVRTLQETIMIVVAPQGTLSRVEVLSFGEPEDYMPRKLWLQQFPGRKLDPDLAVRRGIHGITGATLSARAVTLATRRTLAIHQALGETQ